MHAHRGACKPQPRARLPQEVVGDEAHVGVPHLEAQLRPLQQRRVVFVVGREREGLVPLWVEALRDDARLGAEGRNFNFICTEIDRLMQG